MSTLGDVRGWALNHGCEGSVRLGENIQKFKYNFPSVSNGNGGGVTGKQEIAEKSCEREPANCMSVFMSHNFSLFYLMLCFRYFALSDF